MIYIINEVELRYFLFVQGYYIYRPALVFLIFEYKIFLTFCPFTWADKCTSAVSNLIRSKFAQLPGKTLTMVVVATQIIIFFVSQHVYNCALI